MTVSQNQIVRKPVSIAIGDKIVARVQLSNKMYVPVDCRVLGYKTIGKKKLLRVYLIAKRREILIEWGDVLRNRGNVS